MKLETLQPTQENIKDSLIGNWLGRNKDISGLIKLLNSHENAMSLALNGDWGSGKTFFVLQTKMVLDALNPLTEFNDTTIEDTFSSTGKNEKNFVTVYYDAWSNDYDEDPIISLCLALMDTIGETPSSEHDIVEILGSILELISGRSFNSVFEKLKGKSLISQQEREQTLHQKFKELLNLAISEKGDRMVFFIDELDRCNPQFAIRLLERIKHYLLLDDRVTFIYAINKAQLQHTVKKCYGEEFDANRYLDRFFDFILPMPVSDLEKFYEYIGFHDKNVTYEIASEMIKRCNMQYRDIVHYLNAIAYIDKADDKYSQRPFSENVILCFFARYFLPIAISLEMTDSVLYKRFITGQAPELFVEITSKYYSGTQDLLGYNEAYEKNPQNTSVKIVSKKDKIQSMYDTLFKIWDIYRDAEIRIGRYEFYPGTKDKVFGLLMESLRL